MYNEALAKRFKITLVNMDEIMRAAKELNIPEEEAEEFADDFLTEQAVRAYKEHFWFREFKAAKRVIRNIAEKGNPLG